LFGKKLLYLVLRYENPGISLYQDKALVYVPVIGCTTVIAGFRAGIFAVLHLDLSEPGSNLVQRHTMRRRGCGIEKIQLFTSTLSNTNMLRPASGTLDTST